MFFKSFIICLVLLLSETGTSFGAAAGAVVRQSPDLTPLITNYLKKEVGSQATLMAALSTDPLTRAEVSSMLSFWINSPGDSRITLDSFLTIMNGDLTNRIKSHNLHLIHQWFKDRLAAQQFEETIPAIIAAERAAREAGTPPRALPPAPPEPPAAGVPSSSPRREPPLLAICFPAAPPVPQPQLMPKSQPTTPKSPAQRIAIATSAIVLIATTTWYIAKYIRRT
jgi:hypothetical protein